MAYLIETQKAVSKLRTGMTYGRALMRLYHKYPNLCLQDLEEDATLIQRLVFLNVKMFSLLLGSLMDDMDRKMTEDSLREYFKTVGMIALLTPRQFMQVFPVDKNYDGERYETKDYFYTMGRIEKIGADNVIGEERIDRFLMEYWNHDVMNFSIKGMQMIDKIRAFDGQMGMMEQFMADQGVYGHTYYEEEGIMIDHNGKVMKVQKPKRRVPKYIRVLEGGRN